MTTEITPEITPDTTWFKVTKYSGMNLRSNSPYNIFTRTLDNLSGRQARFGGGYDTRAEAVRAGHANGWIQVDAWYEAEAQAKPMTDERTRRANLYREAIAGKAHLMVTFPDAIPNAALYLDPEAAQRLLDSLGEPDKYGVAKQVAERLYLLKVRQPDNAGTDITVHRTRTGAEATMRETARMWDEQRLPHSIEEIPVLK